VDRSFNSIVIEFDPAIVDEARQALPVRERVADGVGELDLLADESLLGAQPGFEDISQRPAFCCRTRRRSSALRPRISFSIA
jgi:hypothetical protein